MSKITLPAESCWLIRATRQGRVLFFESHKMWNRSPAHATIFRDEAAAEHEIWRARQLGLVGKGEILEAVPLHGALLTLGRPIKP